VTAGVPLNVELIAPEDHGVDAGQKAVSSEVQHRRSGGSRRGRRDARGVGVGATADS
jgi:hypothetical protein